MAPQELSEDRAIPTAAPSIAAVLPQRADPPLEHLTRQIGQELLGQSRQRRAGLFSSRFWSDQMMTWAMHDPAFKVQLFRFVDVFPMLQSSGQVHECLVDYLSQPGVTLPGWMQLGLKAGGLAKGVLSAASDSRAPAPRPAGPTTSSTSSSPAPAARTPCATASPRDWKRRKRSVGLPPKKLSAVSFRLSAGDRGSGR